ncbi:hypothetical protein [Catenulispora pinisilvae]|uniref:hypothetical protein n=1 Tax=Catenulispora pinisilvae TaxID=2705253 RepID=UPI0018926BF7|nr:hypothetical protein [Catenulispora pinisilvae]
MDETHERESTAGGGQAPPEDVATAEAEKPYTAQFAPVETPTQAVSPVPPEEDGFPGGPIPESSGFSWRLPGQPAPVQQAQGGIPNEFDHLFRDAPADGRRSLMPNQGTIGVSVPGTAGYSRSGYSQNPATNAPASNGPGHGAGPGADFGPGPGTNLGPQPTQALPPADSTGRQAPVYQSPTQDQVGYGQQLPSRAYDPGGYSAQAQGQGPVDPDSHTQSIPRVPAQPPMYGGMNNGGMNNGNPDLLLATGPDRRQSNRTLLIALGVFVVLVVVAAVAFSGGGGKSKTNNAGKTTNVDTPAPSTSVSAPPGVDPAAKAQADAIFTLISQSHALRVAANDAITGVQQCKNVAANKASFTDVAAKRQAQADGMKPLSVDKLSGGQQLQKDLIDSWQLSAESEKDYAAWANDNLTCTGKPGANDNFNKGNSAGTDAGRAKNKAVADWNAFAAKLGEQTIEISNL